MSSDNHSREGLLEANAAFYEAFAAGDLARMTALWADRDDLSCTHPGQFRLSGRSSVLASWFSILEAPPPVRAEAAEAVLLDGSGIVTCVEVIDGHRLSATNCFEWDGEHWRMVHHQAGHIFAERDDAAPAGGSSGGGTVH